MQQQYYYTPTPFGLATNTKPVFYSTKPIFTFYTTAYFYRMKNHLAILCLLLTAAHYTLAQTGDVANSVFINEKRGITGSNWTDICQYDDGSILLKADNQNHYWHVTNMSQTMVHMAAELSSVNLTNTTNIGGHGDWFYVPAGNILQRRGDSIVKYLPLPPSYHFITLGKGGVMMPARGSGRLPQYFNGKNLQTIATPPEVARRAFDTIHVARETYTGQVAIGYSLPDGSTSVYHFDGKRLSYLNSYPSHFSLGLSYVMGKDSVAFISAANHTTIMKPGGKTTIPPYQIMPIYYEMPPVLLYQYPNHLALQSMPARFTSPIQLPADDKPQSVFEDRYYNSFYVGGPTQVQRIFPHIIQYPKLYNGSNSNANHSLMQTANGDIWLGSYTGSLSRINASGITEMPDGDAILPGGLGIGNKVYYFTEIPSALSYTNQKGVAKKMTTPQATGYFLTYSRDSNKIYAGLSHQYAFGIASKESVEKGEPVWKMVDSTKGMTLYNVTTITEDLRGRIWYGRGNQGWGVYYPDQDKATTFLMQEKQTSFGSSASCADSYGNVWMGADEGIWYVDASKTGTIKASQAKRLDHPLVPKGVRIESMMQWGKWLVIGIGNKLLLLDLEAFMTPAHTLLMRYFNPEELNLTAACEQNTLLTDRRDSSIWLASSDNVYHIDLKKWLNLPVRKATPTIRVIMGNDTLFIHENSKPITLPPTSNSLQLDVLYQTPDNMPRYVQGALLAENDTLRWTIPDTDHHFEAFNRQTGNYIFHLRIFQQDGSVSLYQFPITIRRFLWEEWWFWGALIISALLLIFYFFDLKRKRQLAEARALRIEAEAETLRSEQKRQLTNMQVISLSNQFRPHFILNALNTVGAKLYDKPEVDVVLGQLGDSIGIVFKNAQAGNIAHPISQEWRLVESVFNIKQMEYRHSVKMHEGKENEALIKNNIMVPMGILQIPVENALTHGLRNKEEGSQDLWIDLTKTDDGLAIIITDNGIGRRKAATISNHRSNGVGSKNLLAVIDLLNQFNSQKIQYKIVDDIFETDGIKHGTKIEIWVPDKYTFKIE